MTPLTRLAAEYGQFGGWLAHDGGDPAKAVELYSGALERAQILSDSALTAYILSKMALAGEGGQQALRHAEQGTRVAETTPSWRAHAAVAEREFRRAVLQLLAEDGVEVLGEVTSGSGAVSAALAPAPEAPDLVVMGGRLAGKLPVWATVRQIRDATPVVHVVVLLDDPDGEAAARCREAGAMAVLDRAAARLVLLCGPPPPSLLAVNPDLERRGEKVEEGLRRVLFAHGG